MQKTFEDAMKKIKEKLSLPKKSKPFIKAILEHGIIILDYQIGQGVKKQKGLDIYESKERSFIRGFMKHEDAHKFITWMNINTDKIVYCIHIDSTEEFEKEYYEGDMTKNQGIVVSIEGVYVDNSINFIPYVKAPLVLAKSIVDFDKTRAHLHSSIDVDMIVCIDPVYGRLATSEDGLYSNILQGLNNR